MIYATTVFVANNFRSDRGAFRSKSKEGRSSILLSRLLPTLSSSSKLDQLAHLLCQFFFIFFFIKARDQTEEHFEVKQRSSRKQEEQTKVSQSTPPLFHTQSDANKMETYEMNRLFSFSHYC